MANFDVKEVIPNIEETFGKIRFAGGVERVEKRVGTGRDTEMKHVANAYALISDKQRKMAVYLPTSVDPDVKFKDVLKFINPVIRFEAGRIQARQGEQTTGFTRPIFYADNIEVIGGGK